MKRINIDRKDEKIKKFVRHLSKKSTGSILELEGKPVLKVLPIKDESINLRELTKALRKRRAESRRLNRDWEEVDRQVWDKM